jgi:LacI family transcriptional regulator
MVDDAEGSSSPAVAGAGKRGAEARLTIKDVARLAQVSIGSVSKALNHTGSLRAETRQRIITAAKHLGFRPNDLAHALHRGQSLTVGVISNDSFGRFAMPIVEGLEECLSDSRISVFMCNATDDPAREARHVESLIGKRVDGIVVTARRADRRARLDVGTSMPVVYVYSQTDDPDALCLLPDDQAGAALATTHLAQLGRKRIAHVTGPERFEAVRLRHIGYRQALSQAGLAEPEGFYLPGVWSEGWGREAVAHLLRGRGALPDAIFCGNDQIARGVADALRERGIAVPGAIAIVGFDNWEIIADATRPPLTSVDMNLKDLGRAAGRQLMELIAGVRLKGVQRLPCRLVVRESCGIALPMPTTERRPRRDADPKSPPL